jgi:hypothetical protein
MRGLIYEIAGIGIFGTIQQTEKVKVYDFFNYLAYKRQNEKAMYEQYSKK